MIKGIHPVTDECAYDNNTDGCEVKKSCNYDRNTRCVNLCSNAGRQCKRTGKFRLLGVKCNFCMPIPVCTYHWRRLNNIKYKLCIPHLNDDVFHDGNKNVFYIKTDDRKGNSIIPGWTVSESILRGKQYGGDNYFVKTAIRIATNLDLEGDYVEYIDTQNRQYLPYTVYIRSVTVYKVFITEKDYDNIKNDPNHPEYKHIGLYNRTSTYTLRVLLGGLYSLCGRYMGTFLKVF